MVDYPLTFVNGLKRKIVVSKNKKTNVRFNKKLSVALISTVIVSGATYGVFQAQKIATATAYSKYLSELSNVKGIDLKGTEANYGLTESSMKSEIVIDPSVLAGGGPSNHNGLLYLTLNTNVDSSFLEVNSKTTLTLKGQSLINTIQQIESGNVSFRENGNVSDVIRGYNTIELPISITSHATLSGFSLNNSIDANIAGIEVIGQNMIRAHLLTSESSLNIVDSGNDSVDYNFKLPSLVATANGYRIAEIKDLSAFQSYKENNSELIQTSTLKGSKLEVNLASLGQRYFRAEFNDFSVKTDHLERTNSSKMSVGTTVDIGSLFIPAAPFGIDSVDNLSTNLSFENVDKNTFEQMWDYLTKGNGKNYGSSSPFDHFSERSPFNVANEPVLNGLMFKNELTGKINGKDTHVAWVASVDTNYDNTAMKDLRKFENSLSSTITINAPLELYYKYVRKSKRLKQIEKNEILIENNQVKTVIEYEHGKSTMKAQQS